MSYDLTYLNNRVQSDAQGFVAECEDAYSAKIDAAAQRIADNRARSPVVLLSGPSGSGKTTTAKRICAALELLGVTAHSVSLDDYFKSPKAPDAPKTPEGGYDFESPQCIDWLLLNEHFSMLERGERILIPHFSFSTQSRNAAKAKPLHLGRDHIAIFEGIHALNDRVTAGHPNAFRLYISARSDIEDNDDVIFKRTWVRLVRRAIRDDLFRGADAMFTLAMWANVRRGEKLNISPFKDTADMMLDTVLPYELHAMRDLALSVFTRAPESIERYGEVREIITVLPHFCDFDQSLVPADSMLREFFGGGVFEY